MEFKLCTIVTHYSLYADKMMAKPKASIEYMNHRHLCPSTATVAFKLCTIVTHYSHKKMTKP